MSTWTLQDAAKAMRRNPTASEALLWERLRGRRLGVKFRRQHVLGRSIADFACLEAGLVVEVDGPIHTDAAHRVSDPERDANLSTVGFETYRVTSARVLADPEGVVEAIAAVVARRKAFPRPSTLRAGADTLGPWTAASARCSTRHRPTAPGISRCSANSAPSSAAKS